MHSAVRGSVLAVLTVGRRHPYTHTPPCWLHGVACDCDNWRRRGARGRDLIRCRRDLYVTVVSRPPPHT